ncbi:HsdS protein [Leuconostoc citreum LBAE C10]|uniref:restriction endonuclease subunit S n=1 Tax=Leuconostoc citreum TaxID=33964 RepID=UPI000246680A|nr:restriction endonuclease subunit S [Leuconostoc citreum]CCF25124.1 HsdS protein [Leuconostoc citreum LBAE C10]
MSKKTPQIRFKGFTDDWEERKLKDVVEKQIKGKAQFEKLAPGEVEYLDTSRLNGGQAILTNGLKDVTLDDILILWDGSKAGTVYHGFEGALGSTLKAYRTSANSKFVYQYLKRHQDNIYNNYRTPNIPHVQKDFLNVFTISVPVSDEQEKIGSFFKQLDDTIDLHQRKLDLLKEQKKGFLQKMFPKNGAKVPELRFAEFADDWEERKSSAIFHTITDFVANGSFASLRENVSYSDKLDYAIVVRLTDYSNGYKGPFLYTSKSGYDFLKKSSLNPNDILISNVGANAGLVFKAPILDVPMTLGPNSILVRTSDQDREFMYQLMRSTTGEHLIKTQIGISAQPKFNKTEFKQIIFTIPKSQEEQQKIGNLFHELDHTIALHQRKLNLLKEQKKRFLTKNVCLMRRDNK